MYIYSAFFFPEQSSQLCLYGGQEKLKKEGGEVLIPFFLEDLILEGKSMSLLKFFFLLFRCVFEAIVNVEVNLGFNKHFFA
jgi:hypothetical protein